MANKLALGKDNINVEQINCTPKEIYKEIANVLNGIYERNGTRIKLGTGILLPLPRAKKTQGPVKNLRRITLLQVIQKVLVENLHEYDRRQDQQTSAPITECVQKIQKLHQCSMASQVDGY